MDAVGLLRSVLDGRGTGYAVVLEHGRDLEALGEVVGRALGRRGADARRVGARFSRVRGTGEIAVIIAESATLAG